MGAGKSKPKAPLVERPDEESTPNRGQNVVQTTQNRGQNVAKVIEKNADKNAAPADSGKPSSSKGSPSPAAREGADAALLFGAFQQVRSLLRRSIISRAGCFLMTARTVVCPAGRRPRWQTPDMRRASRRSGPRRPTAGNRW